MKKFALIVILCPLFMYGQKNSTKLIVDDGDTLISEVLPAVPVGPGSDDFWKKYNHAKYFVPKIYYYAVLVEELTKKYETDMAEMESKKERKKYLKAAKKNLKDEFGDDIREMSQTRGVYLMKLIDRQTNKMAYTILEEYLGKTKAQLWQGISRIGGADLKGRYDPQGEDGYIELVVREIEDGSLKYEDHTPKTEEGKEVMSKRKKRLAEKKARKAAKKKNKK